MEMVEQMHKHSLMQNIDSLISLFESGLTLLV